MAKVKNHSASSKKMRPALTPEARENQMISLAVDLAEQQLRDGTASSQVLTHFLKLATVKERLELKKLESDIKVQEAKAKAYESAEETKAMYAEALKAMRTYSGHGDSYEDDEYYEDY